MIKVSIILPTRNSMAFLKPRVDSIRAQTFGDFEVVVVDTDSTDGTLEYLRAWAAEDTRVKIHSVPPGLYKALNTGVRLSQGEYVYIATSDDTMAPNALERFVAALDAHPECGVCDSLLTQIDEEGRELKLGDKDYLHCAGHLLYPQDKALIRKIPFDFVMHCGAKTVYISLTQIMFRRSLFDKIGGFREDYGPSADYMFGMLLALNSPAVYLPERLATWRIRRGQLTGHDSQLKNHQLMDRMAEEVIAGMTDQVLKRKVRVLRHLVDFKSTIRPLKHLDTKAEKLRAAFRAFTRHPIWFCEYVPYYFWLVHKRDMYCAIKVYDWLIRREAGKILGRKSRLVEI